MRKAAVLIALLIPAAMSMAAVPVTVDPATEYQVIDGFGANQPQYYYATDYYGGRILDLAFKRSGMGITVLRCDMPLRFRRSASHFDRERQWRSRRHRLELVRQVRAQSHGRRGPGGCGAGLPEVCRHTVEPALLDEDQRGANTSPAEACSRAWSRSWRSTFAPTCCTCRARRVRSVRRSFRLRQHPERAGNIASASGAARITRPV